jgi:predicted nucleic acid-binding protein
MTGTWAFDDEHHPHGDVVLDRLSHDSAMVPLHWWFEVRNMLLMGERRRRISERQTTEFLDWLSRLQIQRAPLPNETDIFTLARQRGLTFYDAAYLDLARRTGLSFATLDRDLLRAARREGIPLIGV